MSTNFGVVDLKHLTFPAVMTIDWIRVYQPKDQDPKIGCDPKEFPTAAYINRCMSPRFSGFVWLCSQLLGCGRYIEAYTNPNLTTWRDDYGQPFPKNRLLGGC